MHTHEPKKDLRFAIFLTGLIFLVELLGGIYTGSLALISDSFHMFGDVFALSITLVSLVIAQTLPTKQRTFGLHRAEILAALLNGLLLLSVTVFIGFKAITRLANPVEIHSEHLLVVAVIGLIANLIIMFRLNNHDDLNLKSAWLHVFSDTLSSVAVIVGAIVIYFTNFTQIDAYISLLIVVIIVFHALRLLRDSFKILLQTVPDNLNIDVIVKEVKKIPSVKDIHSIQLWALCSNVNVMTAHILTTKDKITQTHSLNEDIKRKLTKYNIKHTTFQFECFKCQTSDKLRKIKH